MNQAMKQRLVGTLVLGCLALIFIPLLLDGDGITPTSKITAMPVEPKLVLNDISAPQRPQITPQVNTSQAATEFASEDIPLPAASDTLQTTNAAPLSVKDTEAAATTTTTNTVPAFGLDGLPEAWSIRLGIFGERANADALMKKLLADDYKAYSRPVPTSQGAAMTGIFVGPVLTKAEAAALVRELAEKFKVNGIVVQFKTEEIR